MTYKVLDNNALRNGSAKEILEQVLQENTQIEDIKGMSADQYADALLENAGFFLSKAALDSLEALKFATKYDKALKFLTAMPTSGMTIIDQIKDN